MKLFLTSIGLSTDKITDFFLSQLPKPVEQCSVLLIAYVSWDELQGYIDQSMQGLRALGFKDISYINLKKDKFDSGQHFDVIYLFGGNTYQILDSLRTSGAAEFIKDSVLNSGTIFIGASAGSIIAGPDIEIAGWGSEGDTNEIGLQDLTGLNLTDIALWPHYRDPLKDEVDSFKQKVSYPVIEVTDEQTVFVDDSGHKIIG